YIRWSTTRSGYSATQGAHHVAQTLISLSLSDEFFTRSFIPAASSFAMETGFFFQSSSTFLPHSSFQPHFTEHPNALFTGFSTGVPASTASTALRRSSALAVPGFSTASILPAYCNLRSLSNTNAWGVVEGPYFSETAWLSPSYR